jgi:hypothetical protein
LGPADWEEHPGVEKLSIQIVRRLEEKGGMKKRADSLNFPFLPFPSLNFSPSGEISLFQGPPISRTIGIEEEFQLGE